MYFNYNILLMYILICSIERIHVIPIKFICEGMKT